jgi:S1-C subfamily serine protease
MKSLFVLGSVAALVSFAPAAAAKSPAEVEQIAKAVSVEIRVDGTDSAKPTLRERVGSGVIVHRQGNLYTLVTNRHVVCGNPRIVGDAIKFCTLPRRQNYTLIAADQRKYVVHPNFSNPFCHSHGWWSSPESASGLIAELHLRAF